MNFKDLFQSTAKRVLNASFLFSHMLIPLGVLSLYCLSLMFSLPEGVNKVFVTRSAKLFLPITICSFIIFSSVLGLLKIKLQYSFSAEDKFNPKDLILLLLPLTPIVQYMINNSDILSWYECVVIFFLFLVLVSLLIFVVPALFHKVGSTRPLMYLGLAFTFLLTNMASLSGQFNWYQVGSLRIQLLVFGSIGLISWLLYNFNLQNLLNLFIIANFVSNSVFQFIGSDETKAALSADQNDNLLLSLIDSREPAITPGIYLLVYDAYVVNETMLAYGIDNQDQEQYLQDLDFKIYPHTYSVGYGSISTISRVLNSSTSYYGDPRRAVSGDGIVQYLLGRYGYKTYGVFPYDYFFRGILSSYDYSFPDQSSSDIVLSKAIFMGELRFDVNFDRVSEEEYIHEKEKVLSESIMGPRFVYMHTSLPSHSQNSGVCRPNEIELYSERLARANLEMRQDVSLIMENDPDAIIIVAGDHGPYLTKNCRHTGDDYEKSEITRLDVQDRVGTFLAIKWPSSDYEEFDDITVLQDLFPAIFAYMFQDQSLLDSKIEPITLSSGNLSGVKVSDGTILGGIDDGEALFP